MPRFVPLTLLALASPAGAADNSIQLESNATESAENRCQLSFVVLNKDEAPLKSLKLDLAVFSRDGIIYRRLPRSARGRRGEFRCGGCVRTSAIVPLGPELDFAAPHNRAAL